MSEVVKAHEFFEQGQIPMCVFRIPYMEDHRLRHSHDFYEIMIVVAGQATHHFDDVVSSISMGDVYVIPPGHEHSYQTAKGTGLELVNVLFDLEKLDLKMRDLADIPGFHALFTQKLAGHSGPHLKLKAKDLAFVNGIVERIQVEQEGVEPGWEFYCETRLRDLILFLSRRYSHVVTRGGQSVMNIRHLASFLERHLGEPLTFETLLDESDMAATTLRAAFNAAFDCSPMAYLQQLRIKKAMILLANPAKSITYIAGLVGFDNPGYFARVFKKETGESPREFRRRL
jgi:AraC-like DNA-binding protein